MQTQGAGTFSTDTAYESTVQELAQQTTLDQTGELLAVLWALAKSNERIQKTLPEHWEETIRYIHGLPSDQRSKTILVARRALEQHRKDLQQLSEKTALLVRFLDEPGLMALLSGIYRMELPGIRYVDSLGKDLLKEAVTESLSKIKNDSSTLPDKKEALLKHSIETIISDPHLLHQVLRAGGDINPC